jgi:2-dehydropantoate 2-reductase
MTLAWPRIAVVGPGAVGTYFGGLLARAGAPVTMIGRPGRPSAHLDAMASVGLRLHTTTFDERVSVAASADIEMIRDAELVLFAVKTLDTEEATRQMAPHLRAETIVLDLQNGVDNPERMRRLGVDPIAAVVYVAAAIEKPGEVTHRGRGDLLIGHPTRNEDLSRIATWMDRAGIPCRISDDIERELWSKLILNAMGNAICALTNASYRRLGTFEPTRQLAIEVAAEAAAVARADGQDIDEEAVIKQGIALFETVGDAMASTQQDIVRRRPTEIDALNGYIARRGQELGIPTPVNLTLWALVKLREQS